MIAATVVVVIVAGSVLFLAGEDLFGSDTGTIDSYNTLVLDTCEVPPGSTLIRTFVLDVEESSGMRFRTLSYIYASPLDASELVEFYGLTQTGREQPASEERACKFSQRPFTIVVALSTAVDGLDGPPMAVTDGLPAADDDMFWAGVGADVTNITETPPGTRSFVRLRLAQREVDGLF